MSTLGVELISTKLPVECKGRRNFDQAEIEIIWKLLCQGKSGNSIVSGRMRERRLMKKGKLVRRRLETGVVHGIRKRSGMQDGRCGYLKNLGTMGGI